MVALSAALLLATALIYTSFSASTEASKPSEIQPGKSYDVTGKVVKGSIQHSGDDLRFRIRDRDGTESVPVSYTGVVPDPFREGREVIVSGRAEERHVRGRARLARHEVPVEVHRRTSSRADVAGVGSACLAVALLTALYAVVASVYGARSRRREWISSGRRAIYCVAALSVTAFALLEAAFLRSDFSFALVAEGSSTDTPTFYKVTALWATQDGSLLLWVTLLSLFSTTVLFLTRRSLRDIAPYATAVLGCIAAFFLLLMVGWENPFDTLADAARRGRGPEPAAAPPGDDDPPADALHGLRGLLDPVRVRDRRADRGPHGRRLDPRHPPLRAHRLDLPRHGDHAGRALVLHRARLGRLLGLGPGRERLADAVARGHGVPALDHGAGEARDAEGVERVADLRHLHAGADGHVPGAERDPRVDPRVRRLDDRRSVPRLHRARDRRVGGLIIARLPYLRSEARLDSLLSREAFFLLNNLVLVGLCLVILWGTFFPLISEAITGTEASVGPPWFNRLVTPLALVLVLLTAIGPMLAWRRFSPSSLRRILTVPLAVVAVVLVALLALTDAADSPPSLAMFCLVAFVLAAVGQELWRGTVARRTMSGESWPRALARLTGRNRRRYGGFLVHAGIAVLFLGVAASSAFLDQRDVRLSPGESFEVNGYDVTYREATAKLGGDSAGTGAPISFGAVLDVRKDGKHFVLRPSRNYYASGDPSLGTISRFFEGEATSEVDVRWGLTRDFWLAVRPDIGSLERPIREADAKFADSPGDVQALIVAALAERYRSDPPPAAFRAIASPLVVWIWIGGGLAVLGALVAAWPSPEARLRRVRSLYSARVGQELSRA